MDGENYSALLTTGTTTHCVYATQNDVEFSVRVWYQLIRNRSPARTSPDPTVLNIIDLRLLEELVEDLRDALDENTWQLEAARFAEVDVLTKTLALQLRSPLPRKAVVKAAARALGDILLGACGSLLAAKLQWFD